MNIEVCDGGKEVFVSEKWAAIHRFSVIKRGMFIPRGEQYILKEESGVLA